MRTALCDLLGIEHPIVGFTPSEHVAAAISRAGGLGVLGCVRYNDPADLEAALTWMDASTDGRPYGVDVVMPATVPTEGALPDLDSLIPEGHRDFVAQTLLKLGVPPLPDGEGPGDGVLGWLHSVARQHVEVALKHPARLIANALGPPPDDVIARAHERGMLVAALSGKARARPPPRGPGRGHHRRPGLRGGRAHRRDRQHGAGAGDRRRGGRAGAGARRGRDRLRPPDRRRAGPRRGRGVDGLGLADDGGVRADLGPACAARPRCWPPPRPTRSGPGSTAASRPGCCATAGRRPGPSRAPPTRCRCRCRTSWSARRTSG